MQLKIRKHGKEFETINIERPVKIILSDGQEFDISEDCNELIVRCINESMTVNPLCANQIALSEKKDN